LIVTGERRRLKFDNRTTPRLATPNYTAEVNATVPTENGAGRVLGIERISLAMLMPDLAIGAVDLDDAMASLL
jgi:hypothetical protein